MSLFFNNPLMMTVNLLIIKNLNFFKTNSAIIINVEIILNVLLMEMV